LASEQGSSRRVSFLTGALDALFVLTVSIAFLVISSSAIWLIEQTASTKWIDTFRGALDVWFVGHGVGLHVGGGVIEGVTTPAFDFALAPLGLIGLVLLFGRRTARRLASTTELWPAWVGAIGVYWAAAILLTPVASTPGVAPISAEAAIMPPLVYGAALVFSSLIYKGPRTAVPLPEARERIAFRNWLEDFRDRGNWFLNSISAPVLRAGTAIVASLMAISAVVIALLLVFNWINVIRLYEALQAGLLGGITITFGQIALLPNIVVYGASWLTGTGFSIGSGSHVSPLGTELGPVPAFPVFGALPVGTFGWGMVVVAVPVVIAFLATLAIKRHAEAVRFNFASPLAAALSVGIGVGLVAGVELGVLGWLASGGIGPDRLGFFGVNPWVLTLVTFIEVAPAATLAAFYSTRPQRANPIPDHLKR
jgi:hypothetical protein